MDRSVRWACAALAAGLVTAAACDDGAEGDGDAAGDAQPAPWVPRDSTPSRSSTTIPILVVERSCAGGRRADGRVVVDVDESDERVVVRAAVRPLDGEQSCPENPATPAIVELERPLGDRELVDGTPEDAIGFDQLAVVPPGPREPIPVAIAPSPLTAVDIVTSTPMGDASLPDLDCAAVGSDASQASTWTRDVEFEDPETVLSAIAAGLGSAPGGWHEYSRDLPNPGGPWRRIWVQLADGAVVTVAWSGPGTLGWFGGAFACPDLSPSWSPDEDDADLGLAGEERSVDQADVAAAIAATSGIADTPAGPTIEDSAARCGAWIALQDALEADGVAITVAPDTGAWPDDAAADAVTRSSSMTVRRTDGSAATISVDASGVITVDAAPRRPADGPLTSLLTQCRLEEPIPYRP